ncbi:MAG: hypothetical protein EB828_03050 [Nitrosopumilus sp. D6]|nr:MAG: hypothetical protein EB828_03050 [Nitrosopumilus sp. D6]
MEKQDRKRQTIRRLEYYKAEMCIILMDTDPKQLATITVESTRGSLIDDSTRFGTGICKK